MNSRKLPNNFEDRGKRSKRRKTLLPLLLLLRIIIAAIVPNLKERQAKASSKTWAAAFFCCLFSIYLSCNLSTISKSVTRTAIAIGFMCLSFYSYGTIFRGQLTLVVFFDMASLAWTPCRTIVQMSFCVILLKNHLYECI